MNKSEKNLFKYKHIHTHIDSKWKTKYILRYIFNHSIQFLTDVLWIDLILMRFDLASAFIPLNGSASLVLLYSKLLLNWLPTKTRSVEYHLFAASFIKWDFINGMNFFFQSLHHLALFSNKWGKILTKSCITRESPFSFFFLRSIADQLNVKCNHFEIKLITRYFWKIILMHFEINIDFFFTATNPRILALFKFS